MYKIEDFAQYYAFSNKGTKAVHMDLNSGDGKIVSFHFERPEFIAALYDYLTSVDLSEYDFKVERQHILTDSYQRLVESNIPFVARSLVHLLRRMLTLMLLSC